MRTLKQLEFSYPSRNAMAKAGGISRAHLDNMLSPNGSASQAHTEVRELENGDWVLITKYTRIFRRPES